MFDLDGVFIEQPVVHGGVEMNEAPGNGASGDLHGRHRFAWFGQIRIGIAGVRCQSDERQHGETDENQRTEC